MIVLGLSAIVIVATTLAALAALVNIDTARGRISDPTF
jgi:hypothetical protein